MKIDVLTLFPEMFEALNASILKRAMDKNLFSLKVHNIRDFAENKHKKCDDYPFGGGAGMVMMPQPIVSAIENANESGDGKVVYLSPKGKTLTHELAVSLSKENHLIFLCGHYEGVDERVLENYVDAQISIGDYVLTGGELPAMVVIDTLSRQIDGVIDSESLKDESHSNNLLEYPQYTRPQNFKGYGVPEVLLSGNHAEIEKWRREKQVEVTKKLRPDLLQEEK